VILIELDPALEIHCVDDLTVLDLRLHIHSDNVLTDGETGAGKRGADGEAFPVVFGDIGGTDARNDPRIAELEPVVVADADLEINGGEDRLVAVGLDALSADRGAHDVEV